jgi:hypothetical protein
MSRRNRTHPKIVTKYISLTVLMMALWFRPATAVTNDQSGGESLPDRSTVLSALEGMWKSLESFEFRCEQFVADAQYKVDLTKPKNLWDFSYQSGGRWALKWTTVYPDGREVINEDQRFDGREHRLVMHVPNEPNVVDEVRTRNQEGGKDFYPGPMFDLLWVVIPGQQPLYTRLTVDSPLAPTEVTGDQGYPVVRFPFRFKTNIASCRLDPQKDWLPTEVLVGGGSNIKVTKFTRDNGRWFPAEGRTEKNIRGQIERSLFIVTQLHINRTVQPGVFQSPPLQEGAMKSDLRTNKGEAIGGRQARQDFVRKHFKTAPPPVPLSPGNVASRNSRRFPWALLVGGLALGILVIALVFRRMGR